MDWKGMLWKLLKWIFKLALKIFLIVLYGTLSLIEIILIHFNKWLKGKI